MTGQEKDCSLTQSSNYTHNYEGGVLVACFDGEPIYDENGSDTGFCYCPHLDETFGAPSSPENVETP